MHRIKLESLNSSDILVVLPSLRGDLAVAHPPCAWLARAYVCCLDS